MNKYRGGKILELLHCPFAASAEVHYKIQPEWPVGLCYPLAPKDNIGIYKVFLPGFWLGGGLVDFEIL